MQILLPRLLGSACRARMSRHDPARGGLPRLPPAGTTDSRCIARRKAKWPLPLHHHQGKSRDPCLRWIPAFAGMTTIGWVGGSVSLAVAVRVRRRGSAEPHVVPDIGLSVVLPCRRGGDDAAGDPLCGEEGGAGSRQLLLLRAMELAFLFSAGLQLGAQLWGGSADRRKCRSGSPAVRARDRDSPASRAARGL